MDGPSPMCVRGPGPFKSGSTNISARHVMYGGTAPRRPPPSCSAQAPRLFCSSAARWCSLVDRSHTRIEDGRASSRARRFLNLIVGASHRCAASI